MPIREFIGKNLKNKEVVWVRAKNDYCIELFNPKNTKKAIPIKLLFKNNTLENVNDFIYKKNIKTVTRETADSFLMKNVIPIYNYSKSLSIFIFDAKKKLVDDWEISDDFVIGFVDVIWFNSRLIKKDGISPIDILDDDNERMNLLADVFTDPDSITDEYDGGTLIFEDDENPIYIENIYIKPEHRRKGIASYILENLPDFVERLFGYNNDITYIIPTITSLAEEKEQLNNPQNKFQEFTKNKLEQVVKMLNKNDFEPCIEEYPDICNVFRKRRSWFKLFFLMICI